MYFFLLKINGQNVCCHLQCVIYAQDLTVYIMPLNLNMTFEVSPPSVSKYPHALNHAD